MIPGIWEELLVLQGNEADFLQLYGHREGAPKPLFPDRLGERWEPDIVVEKVQFGGVFPAQPGVVWELQSWLGSAPEGRGSCPLETYPVLPGVLFQDLQKPWLWLIPGAVCKNQRVAKAAWKHQQCPSVARRKFSCSRREL